MATNSTVGSHHVSISLSTVLKAVADYLRTRNVSRPEETGVWTHGARGL